MNDKQGIINKILNDFVDQASSVQAAAVMTRDGIPVASKFNTDVNEDRLSAMSASLLSLADRAAMDFGQGTLKQVLIDSTDGLLLLVKVGDNAVLSVISEKKGRLGLLLVEARKSASILASAL